MQSAATLAVAVAVAAAAAAVEPANQSIELNPISGVPGRTAWSRRTRLQAHPASGGRNLAGRPASLRAANWPTD